MKKFLLVLCLLLLVGCGKESNVIREDYEKDNDKLLKVDIKDNKIEKIKIGDIKNNLDKNGIVYFCMPSSDYCRNNIEILIEIVNDLNEVKNHSKENIIVKILEKLIIKLKIIIKENKKNTKLIRNDISKLYSELNKINKKDDITKKSENKMETMTYTNGRYVGQFEKRSREGNGTYIFDNGDKYEGEWKNNNQEGKGIYYFKSGDVYEGEWKNNIQEGKGIHYYKSGAIC